MIHDARPQNLVHVLESNFPPWVTNKIRKEAPEPLPGDEPIDLRHTTFFAFGTRLLAAAHRPMFRHRRFPLLPRLAFPSGEPG